MDTLIVLLYAAGLFFNFSAVLGMLRLPDIYCRLHSSSKNTTLGSLLIVAGFALRAAESGAGPAVLKILLIAVLLLVVTPIGSHALARAAYKRGTPLWGRSVVDQYAKAPRPEVTDVSDR
jgi:multicomponent Na+:H+ antiporter subunit G